jgi:hypothetical protein
VSCTTTRSFGSAAGTNRGRLFGIAQSIGLKFSFTAMLATPQNDTPPLNAYEREAWFFQESLSS